MSAVVENGRFKIHNGNVFYGYTLIMYRSTPTSSIVSTDVRGELAPEDQCVFDDILFNARSSGAAVTYVDTLTKLFDTKKYVETIGKAVNFDEVNVLNTVHAIGLTREEMNAKFIFDQQKRLYDERVQSVREKLQRRFSAPKLPNLNKTVIDFKKIFGDTTKADKAEIWVNDSSTNDRVNVHDVKQNLLRINNRGDRVECMTDYKIGLRTAEAIVKGCVEIWSTRKSISHYGSTIYVPRYNSNTITAHNDHVRIGCQSVPRSEVERIGHLMNWI